MTKRAWSIIEPLATKRSLNLIDLYRSAATRWNGLDDIVQVAHAAVEGRIDTLLVEDQREVPGKIHPVTGDITFDDLSQPDIDDVLDDLAVMVMSMKGTVHVLPAQAMPTATGVAAILRY
jgi:stalled ribosome rescue protein Dom34